MSRVSGHPQDNNLIFSGTGGGTARFVDLSGAGTTVLGQTVNVGENKELGFRLLISGAVTGDTPAASVRIEDSANGSTGWAVRETFASQSASFAASGTVAQTEFPRATVRTATGRGYLRATAVLTGSSTLAFSDVAVLCDFIYDTSAP